MMRERALRASLATVLRRDRGAAQVFAVSPVSDSSEAEPRQGGSRTLVRLILLLLKFLSLLFLLREYLFLLLLVLLVQLWVACVWSAGSCSRREVVRMSRWAGPRCGRSRSRNVVARRPALQFRTLGFRDLPKCRQRFRRVIQCAFPKIDCVDV